MKINGNEVRVGNLIEHRQALWSVVKAESVKPGKGGAYRQVELKNIIDGTKLNERFRSSEPVTKVVLLAHNYQFLYSKREDLVFMNQETFGQVIINRSMVGKRLTFLSPGMVVQISFYREKAISVTLPQNVSMAVYETEPTVRGQTITASYKMAILENGDKIKVPPHIQVGELVVVDTVSKMYVERAQDPKVVKSQL